MTTPARNGAFPRDVRSAAELYLSKGLAPIPLPERSKDPGYSGWQNMRITAEALDQHFPPGGARNLGVLNGEPSGNALDVDLDCPQTLLAASYLLPPTGWVFGRNSAPRSHWVYRTDRPLSAAQEKYPDFDGTVLVELRGTGGLTVYPPSTHKETGETVAWDRFTEPAETPLDELRAAVRALAAVALLARHWPTRGTRQDAFLALVGGLLRAGWVRDRTERFVEALATATRDDEPRKRLQVVAPTYAKLAQGRKATGWSKLEELLGRDGMDVVRRVRDWLGLVPTPPGGDSPRARVVWSPEPYQPFPLHALPPPLAEFVRQGAEALGCDPAYLALPALAVVASVVGNTRTIRLKRGWEEPSVVWAAIVGDSGTLKTPAYLKAVAHVFRLQKRLLQEYKEKSAKYREELHAYQAEKAKAKKEGTDPGQPPEEPQLQRVVCSDTTIEKLAEILEDNPRGTLAARDELAGWLGSFTRYKGQKGGTDLPNWLEMHRAGTVIVDRKTSERQTLFISRAAVSITGGIQPGILASALTPEFLDAGLAARLLVAMLPRLPKRWSEAEVDPDIEQAYHDALDRLLALDFDTASGEKAPHVLSLSPEAKTAWVAFYNGWAREQAGVEGELAAAFSKLEGYAARFALLHHVATHVGRGDDDLVPMGHVVASPPITLMEG